MRKPVNSKAITVVKNKEIIMIDSDSDTEEVSCRTLAICAPEPHELALAEYEETNKDGMEIVCIEDDLVVDMDYHKYLENFSYNTDKYLLEYNERESSPLLLTYNVDKKAASGKAVENVERRVTRMSSVAKKVKKTENGRAVHKSVSRGVLKIKETKQKKIAPTKKTRKKKEDVQCGRKSSAVKKEERGVKRNAKSLKVMRASKRTKTENSKTTQGKKKEALQGRKIHVTKKKSKSLVKDESVHKFKACKKENEKSLSLIDKSYTFHLQFLRNALTIFQPEQQVEDLVTLTDPDIIAISNHPFPDGGNFPFQASKDEKIIDLEDGIVSDDMFKTPFSKELLEILRKPYDKMEFPKFKSAVSLKRPLTRSRELRDGRDFSYVVANEFTLSFLEQYPDFKKVLHRCKNDCPRALNLLRGFFFYLENIVYVGSFQPWKHEKRLMDMIK